MISTSGTYRRLPAAEASIKGLRRISLAARAARAARKKHGLSLSKRGAAARSQTRLTGKSPLSLISHAVGLVARAVRWRKGGASSRNPQPPNIGARYSKLWSMRSSRVGMGDGSSDRLHD